MTKEMLQHTLSVYNGITAKAPKSAYKSAVQTNYKEHINSKIKRTAEIIPV